MANDDDAAMRRLDLDQGIVMPAERAREIGAIARRLNEVTRDAADSRAPLEDPAIFPAVLAALGRKRS